MNRIGEERRSPPGYAGVGARLKFRFLPYSNVFELIVVRRRNGFDRMYSQ